MNNGGFELSKSLLYLYIINKNEEVMKIKTQNDQLRDEIDKLDSLLRNAKSLKDKAWDKLSRKRNWGWLSFISTSLYVLEFDFNYHRDITYKLEDYRVVLNSQIKV